MRVGEVVLVRCKVTNVEGDLVRVQPVSQGGPIGLWVDRQDLEDSLVEVMGGPWSEEDEANYRARHQD